MADSEQGPATPSWNRTGDQRWRGRAARYGPDDARRRQRRQLLVLTVILLVLAGIAAAFFLYVDPRPAPLFLSFPIREYRARAFPINAFAVQDGELLQRHFDPNFRKLLFDAQEKGRLTLELGNLRTRADRPVVLHLSALAMAREGEVDLFPADADPADESSWLSLRELLRELGRCPAPGKLLLLDIARPLAGDPRLPVLADQTAERVQEILAREPLDQVWVLISTSGGQASLLHPVQRCSNFAYYLHAGLGGQADGFGGGRVDRRITVKELAEFVKLRVDRWAQQNRNQRQTPQLFGQGPDFVIVNLEPSSPPDPVGDLLPYPPWLKKGWEKRDQWFHAQVMHQAPRAFRQLEAQLLRLEQQWRGGFEPKDLETKLIEYQDLLDMQVKEASTPLLLPPRSLALQIQGKPRLEKAFQAFKAELPRVGKFGKDEEPKVKELILAPTKEKDFVFAHFAASAFEAALSLPQPSPDQLRFVLDVLQSHQPGFRAVETLALQRLVDFWERIKDNDPKAWPWKAETAHLFLKTVQVRETFLVEASRHPALLPWLRKDFAEAEKLRREAEQGWLWENYRQWPAALALLQRAHDHYRQLLERLQRLATARRELDEAFAVLPGFEVFLRELPELTDAEERSWRNALAEAKKLADYFAYPPQDLKTAGDDLPRFTTLGGYLKELDRILQHRFQRVLNSPDEGGPEEAGLISLLLDSPRLNAGQREETWKAAGKLLGRLQGRTEAQDRRESSQGSRPPAFAPPPPAEQAWPQLVEHGLRRARLALDLLRLGGAHAADPVQKALRAAEGIQHPKELQPLAQALQQAWTRQLTEQLRSLEKEPLQADRLSRILPPLERGLETDQPAGQLQGQYVRQFKQWLSDTHREESKFLKTPTSQEAPALSAFYLEAAQELLR